MPYNQFTSQFDLGNQFLLGDPFGQGRQGPAFPPLPDAEADSLLAKMTGGILSGLGYVGDTLSKPGKAIRGTISGLSGGDYGGGLLNLIPLSDAFGWTDPEKQITGQKLNEHFGWTDPGDNGWGAWLGGIGTDIATDPLSYIGGLGKHALNTSGKAAEALGIGAKTRVDRLQRPFSQLLHDAMGAGKDITYDMIAKAAEGAGTTAEELLAGRGGTGGLAKLNALPFGLGWLAPDASAVVGTGETAQKIAKGMDVAGDWLGKTQPALYAKGLFNQAASGGKFTQLGQDVEALRNERIPMATEQAAKNILPLSDQFHELADKFAAAAPEERGVATYNPITKQIEGGGFKAVTEPEWEKNATIGRRTGFAPGSEDATGMRIVPDAAATGEKSLASRDQFNTFMKYADELHNNPTEAASRMGFELPEGLANEIKSHIAAQQETLKAPYEQVLDMGGNGKMFSSEEIGYAPRMGLRPAGMSAKEFAEQNLQTYSGNMKARQLATKFVPEKAVQDLYADKLARGDNAIGYIRNKPDLQEYLGKGYEERAAQLKMDPKQLHAEALAKELGEKKAGDFTGKYVNDYVGNYERAQIGAQKVQAGIGAVHDFFGQWLNKLTPGEGGVALENAFHDVGLNAEKALDWHGQKFGLSPDELKSAKVPQEVVTAAKGVVKSYQDQEYVGAIGGAMDSFLKWFRNSTALAYPSLIAKHLVGGLYNLFAAGGTTESVGEVKDLGSRLLKSLTTAVKGGEATEESLRNMKLYNFGDKGTGFMGVSQFEHPDPLGRFAPHNPYDVKQAWQRAGENIAENPQLPFPANYLVPDKLSQSKAFGTVRQAAGTELETMKAGNEQVRFALKDGYFKYLTEDKGWSPSAAGAKIREVFYDYARENYTPFENQVMKRIIPFYSFVKGAVPQTINTLLERPGGALANTIRVENSLRKKEGYVPDYIGHGMAIPLGESAPGTQRFLTTAGLPFEHLGDVFRPGHNLGDTVKGTLDSLLGMTNPLIKGPLEVAAGKQFYSGRDLSELDSRLGRIAQQATGMEQPPAVPNLIDQIAMNSPFSRMATTLGTLIDPRKGWGAAATNILSGSKIQDANLDKARDLEARKLIEEDMKQPGSPAREFSRLYVPKAQAGQLTPEETQKMRLYQNLELRSQKAALMAKAKAGDRDAQMKLLKMQMEGK